MEELTDKEKLTLWMYQEFIKESELEGEEASSYSTRPPPVFNGTDSELTPQNTCTRTDLLDLVENLSQEHFLKMFLSSVENKNVRIQVGSSHTSKFMLQIRGSAG